MTHHALQISFRNLIASVLYFYAVNSFCLSGPATPQVCRFGLDRLLFWWWSKIFHSLRNKVTAPNVYACTHHLVLIKLGTSMKSSISSIVRKSAVTVGLSTLLLLTYAATSSLPAKIADGVLTGPNDMTLYTFDKDVAGSSQSVCNGPCATNWPPLTSSETDQASGDFTVIARDDGKKQWAFKGKPLYFWSKDSKPGDKTGDGFNKMWQVARP
jgi:predicted lipoprotein with Yx(FWY)xxD motif